MSNTEIASAMIDGLSTIAGVILSDVELDGKRRPSRIPPQTQRRTIQGNGELVIAVLA